MPELTNIEIRRDPTGFPLIRVEAIRAWMHFFPLTKIQFEIFLANQADPHFSDETYRQIRDGNPRLHLGKLDAGNYWQSFLTGILPHEAEKFAGWCGERYRVPTVDQWRKAYRYLARVEAPPIDWNSRLSDLSNRLRELLKKLDEVNATLADSFSGGLPGRSLAERMFLKLGVVEWVRDSENPPHWGGLGDPHPSFASLLSSLESGDPIEARDPDCERVAYFGLRLICLDPPDSRAS